MLGCDGEVVIACDGEVVIPCVLIALVGSEGCLLVMGRW